jgi:hypothetical protein
MLLRYYGVLNDHQHITSRRKRPPQNALVSAFLNGSCGRRFPSYGAKPQPLAFRIDAKVGNQWRWSKKGGGRQLHLPTAHDGSKGTSCQALKEAQVFSNRNKRFKSRSVIAIYKLLSSGCLRNQFAHWLRIEFV